MNTEFIPPTLADRLKKDLDFKEACFAIDLKNGNYMTSGGIVLFTSGHRYYQDCAITYHQAFKWFRERYKLYGSVIYAGEKDYYYTILSESGKILEVSTYYLPTFEEAEMLCLDTMTRMQMQIEEEKLEDLQITLQTN
jgi:hypothetical protein